MLAWSRTGSFGLSITVFLAGTLTAGLAVQQYNPKTISSKLKCGFKR